MDLQSSCNRVLLLLVHRSNCLEITQDVDFSCHTQPSCALHKILRTFSTDQCWPDFLFLARTQSTVLNFIWGVPRLLDCRETKLECPSLIINQKEATNLVLSCLCHQISSLESRIAILEQWLHKTLRRQPQKSYRETNTPITTAMPVRSSQRRVALLELQ